MADAFDRFEFLDTGLTHGAHRTEIRQQTLLIGGADARNVVEGRPERAFAACLPMVGDGEPVGFVTHPLQQVEAFGGAFEDDRVVIVRHPHFFEPLGQTAHRHVFHTAISQGLCRRHDLRLAAVDHHKIGFVGEMPAVGVLLHHIAIGGLAASSPLIVEAFAAVAGDVAMFEPARQRLIQRGKVIKCASAVVAADREPPVFGFLGDAVFEHHHRRHLKRASHGVRDVVAFDAQWGLVQSKRLCHIVHGRGACADVVDAAHLAALQRLLCVLVGAVEQLLLVAAHRHGD